MKAVESFGRLRQLACDIFFPSCCPGCGKRLPGEPRPKFCAACEAELRSPAELPYRRKTTGVSAGRIVPWVYEGAVRRGLHLYKFRGKNAYRFVFAEKMAEAVAETEPPVQADYVTYIPVSAKRKRKRGYDQAKLLAEETARLLGLPCVTLLRKVGDNPPQSGLDAAARSANVVGMYALAENRPDVAGAGLLVVDDIFTTGSTMKEAAFVLSALAPKTIYPLFAAETELEEKNFSKLRKPKTNGGC